MNQAQNVPLDLGPVLQGRDQEMMASQQLKAKQFADDQAAKQQAFHQAHTDALQMNRLSSARASFKDKMKATMGAIKNNAQGLGSALSKGDENRKGQGATKRFGDIGDSLRQAKMQEMLSRGRGGIKESIKAEAASMVKQGTTELLEASWKNLIDSYGLTLLWINAHVFLRHSLPNGKDYFCALGEEWMPKGSGLKGGGGSGGMGGASVPIFGMPGKGFGILEIIALAILDGIVIAAMIVNLSFYAFMIFIIVFPIDAAWELGMEGVTQVIRTLFQI